MIFMYYGKHIITFMPSKNHDIHARQTYHGILAFLHCPVGAEISVCSEFTICPGHHFINKYRSDSPMCLLPASLHMICMLEEC